MDSDPFWKRSGFGALIYALAALVVYWTLDGQTPTSADVLEVVGMALLLLGYQWQRPTVSAKSADQSHDQILALLEQTRAQVRVLQAIQESHK